MTGVQTCALPILIAGPSEYVGRSVTLLVGVLTIPATYLLAREIGGRHEAWIAATLLAVSSAHTLATSHPAWSHALAPLLLTMGIWQVARSLKQDRPSGLAAAGAWLGLALQIHLTMLATLPGIAIAIAIKRWQWIRTPWPYVAAIVEIGRAHV